jgi:hypothetical protein
VLVGQREELPHGRGSGHPKDNTTSTSLAISLSTRPSQEEWRRNTGPDLHHERATGVASLPLGSPVELEVILEVNP